ncbi:MAG: methyl-accepting chemotaxis protein [Bacillota bacterium]
MKQFKKLGIGTKLIALFLLVALVAGVAGFFGVAILSEMVNKTEHLFVKYGHAQGYLGFVVSEFNKQRVYLSQAAMNQTAVAMKEAQVQIEASDKILLENLKKYGDTRETDAEITAYEKFHQTIEDFRSARDETLQNGLNGSFGEFRRLITSETLKTAINNANIAVNLEISKCVYEAGEMVKNQGSSTRLASIALTVAVGVSVVLAVGAGIYGKNSVVKPLRAAAKQLSNIASGAETEELETKSFSGEFAIIASNLNDVRASIKMLIEDVNSLVEAAIAGELSYRADIQKHHGNYQKLIEGVNHTLDAVIKPVEEATAVLREMSRGNLNVSVVGEYQGDHAVIKNSLNDTIATLKGYIEQISQTLGEVADGNLSVRIDAPYRGDFVKLKETINAIVDHLNIVMQEINAAAEQVSAGTLQLSAASQSVSQGATEQASAIEELTSTVADIAGQTKQNAENANRANEIAQSAQKSAQAGDDRMKQMFKAMQEIKSSSASISKIIKSIDDIAFQTNILALNAAVEAAHAGAHGKGFAVVAEEVRNLAARSAKAAQETTDLIEDSIKKIEVGMRIADETQESLHDIVEDSVKSVQLVAQIASASNEQASAIAQVDKGIEQVFAVVQTNSATSEETAAAAEELSGQAGMLKRMMTQFKTKGSSAEREQGTDKEPMGQLRIGQNNTVRSRIASFCDASIIEKESKTDQAIDEADMTDAVNEEPETVTDVQEPVARGGRRQKQIKNDKTVLNDTEFGKY